MITFDEVGEMLDDIADEIPRDFFKELNGGIVLLPDTKVHKESGGAQTLYTLGEYHNDRQGYGGLGRYITIFYGSFTALYGRCSRRHQKEELRKVLLHEFTHHLESLAGEYGLEIKDAIELEKYRRRRDRGKKPKDN